VVSAAAKSRRRASRRPAARARLSEQKLANLRQSTLTCQRSFSSRSMVTVWVRTAKVA
jgi:hypothetical protein